MVAFVVPPPLRVGPVDALVHILPGVGAVEDERGTGAHRPGGDNYVSCEVARYEPGGQRAAVRGFHQGAVADDQGERGAEPFGHRARVMKATSGGQHHFHTTGHRGQDRLAICFRQVAGAVDQRAVDVDRDEADRVGRWRVM